MKDLLAEVPKIQVGQKDTYQNAIKISHRIESDAHSNCLVVFVTGKRSIDDTIYYWQKIIQLCQNNEVENIQLTLALRGKFEPFIAIENYQVIIDLVKPFDFNIGLMDLNGLSQKDSQVACNIASSQGINCAYFEKEIDARIWLNEQVMEAV